jgi:uncharacterized membrane protein YgcG
MLGKVSRIRHMIVGVAIGAGSLLAGIGVIGAGAHEERFDAKTIVVEPRSDGSIRVTEFVDQDFGHHARHGYERVIPNDFGRPSNVVASSPDAPDDVSVLNQGSTTRIRIGDPDVTIKNQHRYVLSYTYPDAMLAELGLLLDIVAPLGDGWPGDNETGRFEVIVVGVELAATGCNVGPLGAEGGCMLELDARIEAPIYRAVLEPLPRFAGLTIEGEIVSFVDAVAVPAPALPERRSDDRGKLALTMIPVGLLGSVPVYRWARRKGRNEVFAGGAADAAYGTLPPPRAGGSVEPLPPVHLIPDDELGELATIEFVPPKGIDPWEASVLMTERIGEDTVEAWFSGLAGREAITLEEAGKDLSIGSGPKRGDLSAADERLLNSFLEQQDPFVTGTYNSSFASSWQAVAAHQRKQIASSGWWKHMPPGSGMKGVASGSSFGFIMLAVFALVWMVSGLAAFVGLLRAWPLAVALGLLLPGVVAYFVYRTLQPARTAQGSALALRAESFRRFLEASEGRHVEWAWENGLLREYSAWAVALGEAAAWSRALDRANVPAPAIIAAGPILIDRMGPSVSSSRTAPSSSGSAGRSSGGFSGGSSGGGGGGGSSGSW